MHEIKFQYQLPNRKTHKCNWICRQLFDIEKVSGTRINNKKKTKSEYFKREKKNTMKIYSKHVRTIFKSSNIKIYWNPEMAVTIYKFFSVWALSALFYFFSFNFWILITFFPWFLFHFFFFHFSFQCFLFVRMHSMFMYLQCFLFSLTLLFQIHLMLLWRVELLHQKLNSFRMLFLSFSFYVSLESVLYLWWKMYTIWKKSKRKGKIAKRIKSGDELGHWFQRITWLRHSQRISQYRVSVFCLQSWFTGDCCCYRLHFHSDNSLFVFVFLISLWIQMRRTTYRISMEIY